MNAPGENPDPVSRLLADRARQGWPPSVADPATLRGVAAILATRPPRKRGTAPGADRGRAQASTGRVARGSVGMHPSASLCDRPERCSQCRIVDCDRAAVGAFAAGSRAPLLDRLGVLLEAAERLGYDRLRVVQAITAPDPTRALLDEARRVAVAAQLEGLGASIRHGRRWHAVVAELGRIESSLLDSAERREVAA